MLQAAARGDEQEDSCLAEPRPSIVVPPLLRLLMMNCLTELGILYKIHDFDVDAHIVSRASETKAIAVSNSSDLVVMAQVQRKTHNIVDLVVAL